MSFTYEEAFEESLKYFNGNELCAKIVVDKYLMRNTNDELVEKSPDDIHKRLATEFARIEENKFKKPLSFDTIYNFFKGFKKCVNQGSPTVAIGNPYQILSTSNCYVVAPPVDSYGGIFEVDQQIVNISRRRGGIGYDISTLRPKGVGVQNAARTTTGAISFMNRFSNSGREVGQCIASGQEVITKNGLTKIEDVIPGDMVWTKIGFVKVLDNINNGIKSIVKLTTERGYTIETTKEHTFCFSDNGQYVEDTLENHNNRKICLLLGRNDSTIYQKLEQKEYLRNSYNNSNRLLDISHPSILNEDLAYFLGYSYGDGNVETGKDNIKRGMCLACSHEYPLIEEQLKNIIENQFGIETHSSLGDGKLNRLKIHSTLVVNFLEQNGLLKQKADKLVFPTKITSSPSSVQMSFIAGIFDADGSIAETKKIYKIVSVCKDFIVNIQKILLLNGIVSKIHTHIRKEKNWKTIYHLTISGYASQSKFRFLCNNSVKIQTKLKLSRKDYCSTPYYLSSLKIKRDKSLSYIAGGKFKVSLGSYVKLKEQYKLPIPIFEDTIISISDIKDRETFDLVLEKENLFWCNGFYVHNSGRRGAQMISISVHHPDIMDFISVKSDEVSVTGANISVRLSDEFLKAVKEDKNYEIRWPVDSDMPKVRKMISAKLVWNSIIHNAWLRAEPGVLFWQNIISESPADCYENFTTTSTNPCGEVPLSNYDSCRLMALNLFGYVKNPFTKESFFDYEDFYKDTQLAQRLMDDLVDIELEQIDKILAKIENDPEPPEIKEAEKRLWLKIKVACFNGRRTGLGITALGDALAALGIKYGSKLSIEETKKIYTTLKLGAYRSSVKMAKELGAFPVWDFEKEKNNPFLNRLEDGGILEDMKKYGRRNIALLTTAPTGTISCLCSIGPYFNTSSGIEPVYKTSFIRRKKINHSDTNVKVDFIDKLGDKWTEFEVLHSGLKLWKEINPNLKIELSPYSSASANDINWTNRVKLQAAAQKHIDHSISSTINLPENVDEEEVAKIYSEAWKNGLKGVTVYRENCRSGVLVDNKKNIIEQHHAPERPKDLDCHIHHCTVGGKRYFVLVGLYGDNNQCYEIFAGRGSLIDEKIKHGLIRKMRTSFYKSILEDGTELSPVTLGCDDSQETITRLVSLSMRHGVPLEFILEQLSKVEGALNDFSRAIIKVLKKYMKDGTSTGETCPSCSSKLVFSEGCQKCMNCSYSKC